MQAEGKGDFPREERLERIWMNTVCSREVGEVFRGPVEEPYIGPRMSERGIQAEVVGLLKVKE